MSYQYELHFEAGPVGIKRFGWKEMASVNPSLPMDWAELNALRTNTVKEEQDEKEAIEWEFKKREEQKLTEQIIRLARSVSGQIIPLIRYVKSERKDWTLVQAKNFVEEILINEGLLRKRSI